MIKRLKEVDFRKGTGTFVLGYTMMLAALFVALVLIEQYSKYEKGLETQMAADSLSDGSAVYASTLRGLTADEFYEETMNRAEDLTDLIQAETNVNSIQYAYMDRDQFDDEDIAFVEITARYAETSNIDETGYDSGNGVNYFDIKRTSATKFTRMGLTGDYVWPCAGTSISSRFGYRGQPTAGASTAHSGVDIPDSMGNPYYAVADGEVVSITYPNGSGDLTAITIYHGVDANGNELYTQYLHGSIANGLHVGQMVRQGERIGGVNTYGPSTGPHVHLNVYTQSGGVRTYYNALKYLYGLEFDGTDNHSMSCTIKKADGSFINTLYFGTVGESACFEYDHKIGNIYYR